MGLKLSWKLVDSSLFHAQPADEALSRSKERIFTWNKLVGLSTDYFFLYFYPTTSSPNLNCSVIGSYFCIYIKCHIKPAWPITSTGWILTWLWDELKPPSTLSSCSCVIIKKQKERNMKCAFGNPSLYFTYHSDVDVQHQMGKFHRNPTGK